MAADALPRSHRGWPWDPKLPNELSQKLLVGLRVSQRTQVRSRPAPDPRGHAMAGSAPSVSSTQPVQSGPTQHSGVGVGKRAFAVGDVAYYWSTTHRSWIKTNVLSLNKDAAGVTLTYNLDCKSKVEAWQMRRLDEPRDVPDVSENAGGGFAVGMPVQCFNQQEKRWCEGIVTRRYQHEKIIVFDVESKGHMLRMLPAGRLRLSRFAVGDTVEYWSATSKSWIHAKVMRLSWAKRTCDLDIKRGAPLANVRKVRERGPSRHAAAAPPGASGQANATARPPMEGSFADALQRVSSNGRAPERGTQPDPPRQSRSRSRHKGKAETAEVAADRADGTAAPAASGEVHGEDPSAPSAPAPDRKEQMEPAPEEHEAGKLGENENGLLTSTARDVRDMDMPGENVCDVDSELPDFT